MATGTPASLDEDIAGFPPEKQAILEKIRLTIRNVAPDAKEAISYRMPTFMQDGVLVHFAGFKSHVGLDPPISGDAKLEEALAPYAGEKATSHKSNVTRDEAIRIMATVLTTGEERFQEAEALAGGQDRGGDPALRASLRGMPHLLDRARPHGSDCVSSARRKRQTRRKSPIPSGRGHDVPEPLRAAVDSLFPGVDLVTTRLNARSADGWATPDAR